jgi:Protein of unknown function (DUF2510)
MAIQTGPARRRGRWPLLIGALITAASVVLGVTATVIVVRTAGRPLAETFTNPVRTTPVALRMTLSEGTWTVYEKTGTQRTDGPPVADPAGGPWLGPESVDVVAADGSRLETDSDTGQTVTRGRTVFTGVARFEVPVDGVYEVRVSSADAETDVDVIIAPALGSGIRDVVGWLGVAGACVPAFVLGLVLLIVGAVRGRRRDPLPAGASPGGYRPAGYPSGPQQSGPQPGRQHPGYPQTGDQQDRPPGSPPPGWYPAPDIAGRRRYWDGAAWTEHLD